MAASAAANASETVTYSYDPLGRLVASAAVACAIADALGATASASPTITITDEPCAK